MRKFIQLLSKIIALCLALCCVVCLSACMGNENTNPSDTSDSPSIGNETTLDVSSDSSADSHDTDKSTTPVGSLPAETGHSHNYVDFQCTGCGAVQDGHLSDYLISYVKKNGTANGETISIDVTADTTLYGLTYNTTGKYFFFSLLDSEYDDFLSIKFTDQKDTYEIAYLQGDEATGREIYGTIYAPEFTKNTPIAVDDYYGPDDERPNAAENARICTVLMLDFLKQFLVENNVGITLSDLGFTTY